MGNPSFAEVLLTVKEVSALGRSERRVLLNATKWGARTDGNGRNGKPVYSFPLDGLPDELQREYIRRQAADGSQQEHDDSSLITHDSSPSDADARLTAALQRFPLDVRDAVLAEARRRMSIVERYLALPIKRQRIRDVEVAGSSPAVRALSVSKRGTSVAELADAPHTGGRPTEEARASSGYQFTPAARALCAETACTNEVLINYYKSRKHSVRKGSEIAIARAVSPATLDTWSRRVRTEGLLLFIPGALASNSDGVVALADQRRAKISQEAERWIEANWRSCPHARSLYRKLKKAAKGRGWILPSERWVYRQWDKLPKIVKVSLHSKKKYVSECAPYVPRDLLDLDALQILCGDHSVRDVTVRLADGSLTRPWLTVWQDLRTKLIWGWHLDLVPSSRTIGLAYANGVKTFGAQPLARPDDEYFSYLYTDQGKDYKSRNIAGQLQHFGRAAAIDGGFEFLRVARRIGLLDDLGLKQILARGYNAREKPVERWHRILSDWEQETFGSEYCGRDAKYKPDAWKDAYARHEKLRKKAYRGNSLLLNDSPFMTVDDYRDNLVGFITEYNHTQHDVIGLNAKIVPIEEHQRLYTTRYDISEQALALLVMKAERRRVGKNGIWMFQRNWSYLHPDLAYHKGEDVEVRYSEDDLSRVFIVLPKGIVEAQLVTPSSIRNPNKQTLATIKHQAAHERQVIRDHSFLTQSIIAGESVEDRVAAQLEPAEEVVEAVAAAGGSRAPISSGFPARVHQLTRLDRLRSVAGPRTLRPVTVDQVTNTAVDESIFSADESSDSGVAMWEEEE